VRAGDDRAISPQTVIVNPVMTHAPLSSAELVDRSKLKRPYAASGRDIQRMSGIAGSTQPNPAST
jgi:hypothetical protein